MVDLFQRHFSYHQQRGAPVKLVKDIIWINDRYVYRPVGPASFDYTISIEDIPAVTGGKKYIMLTCTDGFTGIKKEDWYAVICRNFVNIEHESNSKLKYEINRGLKNNTVRLIDPLFLAENGYDILKSASARYGNKFNVSPEAFRKEILSASGYEDIINYWGIFNSDKLIGYSVVYLYGSREANYSSIKIDPAYMGSYPSYALLYLMNEYYLNKLKFEYSNDGFRTILHNTGIQDFLIKKFNFIKEYTNITVHFNPAAKLAMRTAAPFRKITESLNPNIKALYTFYDLSR